jgi:hypothetical protein
MWMHKGYQLPQDVPLIIGVLLWLVYYETAIHWKPLPKILEEIRKLGNKNRRSSLTDEATAQMDKIWRACGFWMLRLSWDPGPCLRRSLVLYRWCRENGLECKLFVGVGKDGDLLKGHAWLSVCGKVYREDPVGLAKEYVVMLEG